MAENPYRSPLCDEQDETSSRRLRELLASLGFRLFVVVAVLALLWVVG